jgi:hypothetical protein
MVMSYVANVYGQNFYGVSVDHVHALVEVYERFVWPQNERVQSYIVREVN